LLLEVLVVILLQTLVREVIHNGTLYKLLVVEEVVNIVVLDQVVVVELPVEMVMVAEVAE
jgi:hypothetical protein